MNYKRVDRINELILEEISDILLKEIKDPRIGFVTITGVETSVDLSYAKVSVSIIGEQEKRESGIEGLKSASGYIRLLLKKRISVRRIPEIEFVYDSSIEYGDRINKILQKLKNEEEWEK
ncbi:MAG: ribosome-binding factor A [Candidatus Schekmanbacteria bacterium RIFCSPHIGHO2_02_FULL_38_11]|uniref:Ribosome-binding factor A n=1 Tax=Candidatus Schekmanbacteria bacterium RIFCSPLOWO2_12_FULL_38_15 TaxID=1817883 RepID=A0A1F7SJR6_9BACT|nr:MAG: ribosome-binding factor A [Candidatus Schekmanbacteria bacterium GWA2_38_9]OGL50752.1 MAG: ribosome-binding factor A [Candidatus Schekmanbacteria bacterium RIFCSPLOWO2_02_FULL_38_14]OGL53488.1 MAG: ribosome-binding factor A [Candidatus Schekmanbacteria bacterium RIFCSPLOWO2_12_FULL_38_15]OGL54983.1 MAG: ribosome-binding factor A [Candidatus Schekmanbacteria bacterium RIFCSPHIGHO2_02_FULL_38_11]